ncbi:FAD dependent oxidoreductase [Sporothrix schenckii 1099-18]|uniref:FAD-binding domain-containing protein n=2 Tax=Sporothrix schenckii TaxID=29908 RepID=U7PP02_SPOS1|nr:FAD dependent oxidoreductase [Sporothrix schenckii 1099-18]ERS96230.1 hypothetical protein HMPREF1624_07139 [Sporothrix schenckii ATCC 58251]KJR86914.1 FAD dependent oxidoreductase [Sporothrix schenckii 1099-18]
MSSGNNVAIIGAGLSGLTLALALHQQGIQATVYESRPAPSNIGGAVMLSPNALRVLDALSLYSVVKPQGYSFDRLDFRDGEGRVTETYEFGDAAKYGYQGLRIYRHVLIDVLVAVLKEKGIPVVYGRTYSHVVREDGEDGGAVTFAFEDGTTETAALLVGADGIHSTVRRHLYPDLQTTFLGMAGITAAVPTAQLRLPADGSYHIPVTIAPRNKNKDASGGGASAFVIAPQQPDGSEVLIGKQRRILEHERAAWEQRGSLADGRAAAVAFLQEGSGPDNYPDIVANAVAAIDPAKVNVWPFYVVPKLERWASAARRVILLGDAAHAIPPSAGQGINQAFEDVYMLALLLGWQSKQPKQASGDGQAQAALDFWQQYRQARVDKVLELNRQIDLRRMPATDKAFATGVAREPFDLAWLYKPDFKKDVEDWVAQQTK